MTAGDVGAQRFQAAFWKMNAVLIHAHWREDFSVSPMASNWYSSAKSPVRERDSHFPWGHSSPLGWTWAGGHLVVDGPSG